MDDLRRHARSLDGDALVGVQGDRLVVVVGRSNDPLAWAAAAGRPLRARPGGHRAGRAHPRRSRPVRTGGPGRPGGGAGLAGRPPTGGGRRPAARAPAQRRRLGAAAAGRPRLPARWRTPAAALLETVATFLESGRSARGDRAGAVRPPEHRALPTAPCGRRHRLATRPMHAKASSSRSASPQVGWPAQAARDAVNPARGFGGILQWPGQSFVAEAERGTPVRRRGWRGARRSSAPVRASQTPGFLQPWLELPGFPDRLAWLSAVAGVDLVAHGTTSDAETIRDTAVAQPLIVASGLVVAARAVPPSRRRVQRGRRRSGPLRRRDHRGRRGRRAHRRAGDGLRPRARPGDGRRLRRSPRPG